MLPLPTELLELVLSQLPLQELLLSHSLVCKQWRDVINKDTFLPHKKKFYQYKFGVSDTRDMMEKLVKEQVEMELNWEGFTARAEIARTGGDVMLERCLPWLLSLFSTPDMARSLHLSDDLFINLAKHPRYSVCKAMIEDRFTHITTSPLSVLTLILCTARHLADCSKALQLLVYDASPTTELHMLELFYLICSYLLVFESKYDLPPRTQYMVYHALTLHHNAWLHSPTDQFTPQTVAGHHNSVTLTAEQRQIVHMDLRPLLGTKNTIRIMAYAGTGKTTTLVELCRKNPTIRFLLVVFNKSVEVHSKRVFPSNVTVKTANAVSYKYITETEGRDMFQPFELKYTDIFNYLPHRGDTYKGFSFYHTAAMVMDTLTRFYNSEESKIEVRHTPEKWAVGKKVKEFKCLTGRQRSCLKEDAEEVWSNIRNRRVTRIKFDHTSSMKQFQLSKPDLQHWVGPHDVLLLDEAQDMNPCMLSVCLQQAVPKVVVGDQHQQIYSFRGAVNALELVKKSSLTSVKANYYLTQSFRFGAEIAFTANSCLKVLMGERGPDLIGSKKRDKVTGQLPSAGGKVKTAILGRTNHKLFEEMVDLVCKEEEHNRPKIAFATDPTGYGTDPMGWGKLLELAHLRTGNLHLMPGKAQYNPNYKKGWEAFKAQVEAGNDKETLSKILIVEKFGDKLPGYIEILREQSQFGMEDPRVKFVFSTVHKFKGLEMDNVRLLDDFNYIGIPYESPYYNPVTRYWEVPGCMTEIDEFNLLYVALTRAKVNLVLNDALYFLLSSNSVNYSFLHILPVVPAVVGECVKCKEKVEVGGPVALYQDLVRVGDRCRMGGWLCGLCSWSDLRRVNHVLGGKNPVQGWKVNPGTIRDAYIRWVRCLVGPKRGLGDPVQLERHIDKLFERGTTDNEVASWVEEDPLIEEFMFEDEDDCDLLDAVEEFENEFDEDDALLLAVAVL